MALADQRIEADRDDILVVAMYAKTYGDGEVWAAACRLLNAYHAD